MNFFDGCSAGDINLIVEAICDRYKAQADAIEGIGKDGSPIESSRMSPQSQLLAKRLGADKLEKTEKKTDSKFDPETFEKTQKYGFLRDAQERPSKQKKHALDWGKQSDRPEVLMSLMQAFGVPKAKLMELKKEADKRLKDLPQISSQEILYVTKNGTPEEFRAMMEKVKEYNRKAINIKVGLK